MFSRLRKRLAGSGLSASELVLRTVHIVMNEHGILTRASAIAFSSMMAFVPFLMLVMTVAVRLLPVTLGADGTISGGSLEPVLLMLFPEGITRLILEQIVRLQALSSLPVLSVSIGLSIWTSSGLFLEIIDALNRIYGVAEKRAWWKLRLTAIGMTMIQCLILFGSLVLIVAWPQVTSALGLTDAQAVTLAAAKWVLTFVLVLISFALVYQMGPASMQKERWVTPGAVFGTVVFLLASFAFKLYVVNIADYTNAYGPLGGVMMLLFWFWISSLVLLAGAEMNRLVQLSRAEPESKDGK